MACAHLPDPVLVCGAHAGHPAWTHTQCTCAGRVRGQGHAEVGFVYTQQRCLQALVDESRMLDMPLFLLLLLVPLLQTHKFAKLQAQQAHRHSTAAVCGRFRCNR